MTPGAAARALLALLAVLAGAGCAQAPAAGPVVLAPEAVRAPEGPLPPLRDSASGARIEGCDAFVQALRSGQVSDAMIETAPYQAYVGCLVPTLLARAAPPLAGDFDASDPGERIYRELDLATVPSSLAPRRPAERYRLSDFGFASLKISPLAIDASDAGFAYRFEVLARGDFFGSGGSQWLVRFSDRALNGGSYARTSLLVIAPAAEGRGLVASDATLLLHPKAPRR